MRMIERCKVEKSSPHSGCMEIEADDTPETTTNDKRVEKHPEAGEEASVLANWEHVLRHAHPDNLQPCWFQNALLQGGKLGHKMGAYA